MVEAFLKLVKNSEFEGFEQDSARIEWINEIQSPKKEIMPKIEKHSAARTEKKRNRKNRFRNRFHYNTAESQRPKTTETTAKTTLR